MPRLFPLKRKERRALSTFIMQKASRRNPKPDCGVFAIALFIPTYYGQALQLRANLARSEALRRPRLPITAALHSILSIYQKIEMEENTMATINLRDFYPWYTQDEIVNEPDIIAAELFVDRWYHKAHERRVKRNKAQYSLDAEDGIEASAIIHSTDSPEAVFEMMERHCRLCRALNSLPEIQGRKVEAYYILGKRQTKIAKTEGVSESAVSKAIEKGLEAMKKYLINLD